MNPQLNWKKVKAEFNKLTDVSRLKSELNKVSDEIRNFDFHTVLSPTAQERVKHFEKRYAELIKTVHQAQRQVDREFNRVLRQVKGHRLLSDTRLESIRKMAEQAASDLKIRVQKKPAAAKTRKKTAKKTATKRKSTKTVKAKA